MAHLGLAIYCWGSRFQSALLTACLGPTVRELRERGEVSEFWFDRFDLRGPHLSVVLATPEGRATSVAERLACNLETYFASHPSQEPLTEAEVLELHDACRGKIQSQADRLQGLAPNNSFLIFPYEPDDFPRSLSRGLAAEREIWRLAEQIALEAIEELRATRPRPLRAGLEALKAVDHALHERGLDAPAYWEFHASTLLMPLRTRLADQRDRVLELLPEWIGPGNIERFAPVFAAADPTRQEGSWRELVRLTSSEGEPASTWPLLRELLHSALKQLGVPVAQHVPMVLYAWHRSLSRRDGGHSALLPMYPDPVLTASVYCERRQDHALFHLIAPFWRAVRAETSEGPYLWFVRYGRSGDHLKLRIHGPAELRERLRPRLQDAADAYFAAYAAPEPAAGKDWSALPAIDPQDETDTNYADRTLLLTDYRRSPVSLGGEPFLGDDRSVAAMTRCLGAGCDIVLSSLALDTSDRLPHSARQKILLRLLVAGLPVICPEPPSREAYLGYHRDWLVRFAVARAKGDLGRTGEVAVHLDQQILATRDRSLRPLRDVLAREWAQGDEEDGRSAENEPWRAALVRLRCAVDAVAAVTEARLDPYASEPVFAPAFKVFHGLANQLGLDMMNESFAHQLLLRAQGPADWMPILPVGQAEGQGAPA